MEPFSYVFVFRLLCLGEFLAPLPQFSLLSDQFLEPGCLIVKIIHEIPYLRFEQKLSGSTVFREVLHIDVVQWRHRKNLMDNIHNGFINAKSLLKEIVAEFTILKVRLPEGVSQRDDEGNWDAERRENLAKSSYGFHVG
jgi:hypothetical protein